MIRLLSANTRISWITEKDLCIYQEINRCLFQPKVWSIRTCFLLAELELLMKEIPFYKNVHHLFMFIEMGCGERDAGTYMKYSTKIILHLTQDLRNYSFIWGYARTAIIHNAASAFPFRLNRISKVPWLKRLKIWF